MKEKVVENALDFVVRAAKDLWDDNLTEEQQLKSNLLRKMADVAEKYGAKAIKLENPGLAGRIGAQPF